MRAVISAGDSEVRVDFEYDTKAWAKFDKFESGCLKPLQHFELVKEL